MSLKAGIRLSAAPPQPLIKHVFFVSFLCVMLLLGFLPESWLSALELLIAQDKEAPMHYRWFTAHFVHLNMEHTVLNVAGSLVIWLLCVSVVPSALLLFLLFSVPVFISVGMLVDVESVWRYRGFSGVLEGFFIVGAIWQWWLNRLFSLLLVSFIFIKLYLEQRSDFNDAYLLDAIGGFVAVDAHLYGVLAAILCLVVYCLLALFNCPYCIAPWRQGAVRV